MDIGFDNERRPSYISQNLSKEFCRCLVKLLKEYENCFVWDYDEKPSLSRELVEHRLPIKPRAKPIKQALRRFAPEILTRIKEEVERLLKTKFIQIPSMSIEFLI